MRSTTSEVVAALAERRLVARDFLWIVVRSFETGDAVADGQWSDVGNITVDVVNPNTGGSVSRSYFGSGTLIQISDVPLVANLTVQTVAISMSQVSDRVQELVRAYDCKQAQVEIHRGLFDPDSRALVSPAECRFVGFVDTIEIKTPSENEAGSVILNCKSHSQELTRANSSTRSHADQQARLEGDTFFEDAPVVPLWELFWGRTAGRVPATAGK